MLDYQKFIKEEDRKQKIVRQRIADVLTKHGRMNANLNSEAAVYVITNEIMVTLDKKLICT
jgi:hypothetical protein|tara:strand:- start:159 stop:341 length:183 start_codon:yes stop_codon:yes gene_type:complete